MDHVEKIEREIEIKKKLIAHCEKALQQIPKHLRPHQEFVLKIHKKGLEALKQELAQNYKTTKPENTVHNRYYKRHD